MSHDIGSKEDIILTIDDLKKYFPVTGGLLGRKIADIRAVDGVNFSVKRGETFGLVGESGCGKTTLGRCLLKLLSITGGTILFYPAGEKKDFKKSDEYNLTQIKKMGKLRRRMQIVHQDPYDSLNPRMLIKDIVAEPLKTHKVPINTRERVIELLKLVGLGEEHLYRYPHELSGGQLQRVCIARAIALNPDFIVLDEPTSALDVSVQSQILNLLQELQRNLGLTYVFISHDMSVIDYMADRIGVMYLGKMVEIAEKDELLSNPLHPYTKALLSAIPTIEPRKKMLETAVFLKGDVPSPLDPPQGCRFHTRCPVATEKCGWEARDLISFLQTKLDFLVTENIEFKSQGFELELIGKDEILLKIKDALTEIMEIEKEKGIPLFKSVRQITLEDNKIKVIFIKSPVPPLKEVERAHQVACVL